jgi:aspartate/methionine/tyrosine aminotransferase
MTGWRLGWITAPQRLQTPLEMLVEYNFSCIFAPIQLAGMTALQHGEPFITSSIQQYQDARQMVVDELSQVPGVSLPQTDATFYAFFAVDGVTDSYAFAEELIDKAKVGLAPGVAFGPEGEGFLRICYATDHELLMQALLRLKAYITSR